MLTLEETIELILKHKSDYERNDILTMIQEKRNELGPEVINDESAAMIVARELGVDLHKMSPSARQRIEDITESTKNVAGLVGRVDRIGTVRTFARKDGGEGKVASIFISDETGSIRVALWDEMTKAVSEEHISVGSIIQVRGAYVKPGLGDTIELNLGRMGTIKPLENDEIDELGVDFSATATNEMKISDLQENTYDVSLKVEVQSVFRVSTFNKKDGSEGKVLAMVVADNSGSTRLVFWDDKADEIEGIEPGEVIGVNHAYTRPNRDGDGIEIHVGKSTVIERGLKDKIDTAESTPKYSNSSEPLGMKDIVDLETGMNDVDIEGKIATIYDVNTFTRKDGGEGQVQNIVIADKTSNIRVTFWGEDNEHIAKAKEGDIVRILHGYVKEGYRGGVEFQVGRSSKITLNPKGSKLKQLDLSKITENASSSSGTGGGSSEPLGKTSISDLSVEMRDVDVEGKVVTAYDVKTFTRKDGAEGQLRNVVIADQTSKIRVTFWGEDVEKVADVQEGDVIRILHGYVKEGYRGGLEYQVGRKGEIMLNPEDSDLKQLDLSDVAFETVATKASRVLVGEIDETSEGKNVEICGIIVDMGQNRVFYEACPTCNKKLEAVDGGYNCKSCGDVEKPEPRMLYKITIDDGSGSIRATLFGTIGEKLLGMTAEEAQKLIAKSGKEDEPIRATSEKIRGRYIAMHGRVKKFGDSIELSSNGFDFADPLQEIKRLKEVIQKETS